MALQRRAITTVHCSSFVDVDVDVDFVVVDVVVVVVYWIVCVSY